MMSDKESTETYTLSLHDALPISKSARTRMLKRRSATERSRRCSIVLMSNAGWLGSISKRWSNARSEEHTSELQSHSDLVCRLLLEKKNTRGTLSFRRELL